MKLNNPCRYLWCALCLVHLLASIANAADFQHDPTGNLTAIVAAPGVPPTLPAGRPVPVFTALGEPLSLVAPAQSAGVSSYQWFHDGLAIAGATNDVLLRSTTTLADAGTYSLAVRNAYGASTGRVAQVRFTPNYEDFSSVEGLLFMGVAKQTNHSVGLDEPFNIYHEPPPIDPKNPPDHPGEAWCETLSRSGAVWFVPKMFCRNGFSARFQYRINLPDPFHTSPTLFMSVQNIGTNGFVGWPAATNGKQFGTLPSEANVTHSVEIEHDGLTVMTRIDGAVNEQNLPVALDGLLDSDGYGWVGLIGGGWSFSRRAFYPGDCPSLLPDTTLVSWSFTPHSELSLVAPPSMTGHEPLVEIVVNPVSKAVLQGGTAYLKAKAVSGYDRYFFDPSSGSPPLINPAVGDGRLRYQWQFSGVNLADQTNATLMVTNLQPSSAGFYSVAVYNHAGEITENLVGWATNTLAVVMPLTNLFNTGLNDNHLPIAYGAVDPHWLLLPGSPSTDPPVTAYSVDGSIYSNTKSTWLTPSTSSSPGGVSTYRYQTWFWLQPWEAASAIIRGQWSASLQGTDILINGLSTGQATAPVVPFQQFAPFIINRGFVAGSNSLTFVVYNGGGPASTGLRVEFAGGTTLFTKGIFTGDSDADGWADSLEIATFGNLWQSGSWHADGDGVSNADEMSDGTDPTDPASFRPRVVVDTGAGYLLREPNLQSFARGTIVTLTAVPPAGGLFVGWNGSLSGSQNPMVFAITSNMTLQASFTLPYNGNLWPVPGVVQAEDFDTGGEGVAYHDYDAGNKGAVYGGTYRNTDVDMVPGGTGYQVGWSDTGEWLNYTINVASNGIYRAVLRAASGGGGGIGRLTFSGNNQSNSMAIPGTGGWQNFVSVTSAPIRLEAGGQVMQFAYEQPGFDLDYIEIFPSTSFPPAVALTSPRTGQTFAAGVDIALAVSASDPDGSVAKVEYYANGNKVAQSAVSPLAAYWRPPATGAYTISARAIDNVGLATTSAPVTVTVEAFVFGGLKREVYTNIPGSLLADLTNHVRFPNSPDLVEQVGQFESTPHWGDFYGARLSGWLLPPTSGNYRFYLAADDQGVLFLSPDATPANKVQIAAEPQWNGYREYITGVNQASRGNPAVNISTHIPLVAGRAYYVEALLKEGIGGDHLSVAWQPPGGPAVVNGAAPIPAQYLICGSPPASSFQPLSAAALTNSGQIGVSFGRLLNPVTATVPGRYQVVGATVTAATLSPDRQGVLLSVSGLPDATFTVRVSAVEDLFGNLTPASSELIGAVLPQRRQDVGTVSPFSVAGQWDFESGNLSATTGTALQYRGTTEGRTLFGTTESFGIAAIGGQSAKVMKFPATTAAEGFVLTQSAPANGGGTQLNQYSLIMDILFPSGSSGFRSLLQTDPSNASDGELFVNPGHGVGILGAYQGLLTPGAWNRVVFTFDLSKRELGKYLNGVNLLSGPVGSSQGSNAMQYLDTVKGGVDQRWSLGPTSLLFADENNETGAGYVNSIQLRPYVMSSAEVAGMGGPSAGGIAPVETGIVDPLAKGSTFSSRAGEFDGVAGGSDILDPDDHFHFVFESRTGDFDMQVRVESIEAINRWSKAGLMVRETLAANSRNLMVGVEPLGPTRDGLYGGQGQNDHFAQFRAVAGGLTALWMSPGTPTATPSYPNAWIRLQRAGDSFTAYRGTDGANWTMIAQTNQTYPATVFVGLATTSHNNTPGFTALARYHAYGPLGFNPPVITVQPSDVTVSVGGAALLSTTATGSGILHYQWRFNGTNIAGATNETLVLTDIQPGAAGDYRVVVSNLDGLINSLPARLTVVVPLVLSAGFHAGTGGLSLGLNGPPGQRYQIEFSQDLKAWLPLLTITNATGSTQMELPMPDLHSGFYRAVLSP